MRRVVWLALALATTPACSLLLDPGSHTGHTRDGSVGDGGALDAGRDAGSIDANVGPTDAGPDAWSPPECTTPTDCGSAGTSGLVQCVASRCVFCATPTEATPHEVRQGTGLRPYVSLGIRRRPTGPALVTLGTMGTSSAQPPFVHAAPIDAPSTIVDVPLLAALHSTCTGVAVDSVSSIDLFPDDNFAASTSTIVGVMGGSSTTSVVTQLYWMDTGSTVTAMSAMCNSDPPPAAYLPSTTMMAVPSADGLSRFVYQMVRETDGMGDDSYLAFAYPDASRQRVFNGFMSPTDAYARMTSAGPFMLLGANTNDVVVWWDPEIMSGAGLSFVMTPGRTGDASAVMMGTATMAGELLHFVMAYPVGNLVRFVNVDCDTTCAAVGDAVDTMTGAMTVTAARFGVVGDVPVLLTSEHTTSGNDQVVLRLLRANHTAFDAPGGGRALVLDTAAAGASVSDIELAVVVGATTRYAVAWVVTDGSGSSSVRLQTFGGSCP